LDKELAKYKEQLKNARSPAQKQRIKQQAVNVLKRKRMYEQQRENLYNSQFGLDQVAFAQETMNDNVTTFKAMKEATKTLQKQTKKFNIDKMEELQDQMYDFMADVEEINEIMTRSYATPDDIDESELLDGT
jgi:charged multivesicular body protein 5